MILSFPWWLLKMKNLSPRQRLIVQLVTQKGDLAVAEICQATGISPATAYREIQELTRLGQVAKIPGGIGRVEQAATRCLHCGREVSPRLAFLIERQDGSQQSACCAHCGLLALAEVRSAMTTDYLYGTLLNAATSWYVLASAVSPCCRPSVLSFSDRQDAERFAQGFGGEVLDFSTAQVGVRKLMALSQH